MHLAAPSLRYITAFDRTTFLEIPKEILENKTRNLLKFYIQ